MKLLTRKKTNFRATAETNGLVIMPLAPNAECDVIDDNVVVMQNLGNQGAWVKVRVAGLVGYVNAGDVRIKDSASE